MSYRPSGPGKRPSQEVHDLGQPNIASHTKRFGAGAVKPAVGSNNISNVSSATTDADAIAAALNDLSSEFEALEKADRNHTGNPEAIDDLVTVDMYTPLDQIPHSKRKFINPNMEMIPEEEKLGLQKQSQTPDHPNNNHSPIITDGKPEIRPEHFQIKKPVQAKKEDISGQVVNQVQQPIEPGISKPNLPDPNADVSQTRNQPNQQNPLFENLAGDTEDFKSLLMPKSNAYDVERAKEAAAQDTRGAMSREELKQKYKLQREQQNQKIAAQQQMGLPGQSQGSNLSQPTGFLSGLSSKEPYDTTPQQQSNIQQGSGLSNSEGFLKGLASNATDNSFETDLFNRYNIDQSKKPVEPQIPNRPSNEQIWDSNLISPAARAYRDQHVGGGNNAILPPIQQNIPNAAQQKPFPVKPAPAAQPLPQFKHITKPKVLTEQSSVPQLSQSEAKSKTSKRNRKSIRRYFGKYPIWSLLTTFVGLGLIISQHKYDALQEWYKPEATWYLLAGICLVVLSLMWRYLSFRGPKEEVLDEWIQDDLSSLEERAHKVLELHTRHLLLDPIMMSGFPDMDNLRRCYKKGLYGKDHILRYTPRAITIMCFTHDQILTYEGALDLTTGERVYETAREFFYSDIATIGLVKTKVTQKWLTLSSLVNLFLPWRWVVIEKIIRMMSGRPIDESAQNLKEAFQISLKDGNRIEVVLRDGRILNGRAFEEIPLSTDNQVIKAIKEFVVIRKNMQLNNIG